MKTIHRRLAVLVAVVPLSDLSYSQMGSVLDSSQHPASPDHVRGFDRKPLPLESTLSWTKRFKGNEEFNETETLMPTSDLRSDYQIDPPAHSNSMLKDKAATDATGIVVQVKSDQAKIKIEHGPIKRLGMPAMTMVFKVEDVAMLENLKKGQEIGFTVSESSAGYFLTHIEPFLDTPVMNKTESAQAGTLDARGIVKSIRLKDGKIKIEHGPIDRLGMPRMTMMFKVENPALLNGIENGSSVEFSVDNSSGGFVITNIKPVE